MTRQVVRQIIEGQARAARCLQEPAAAARQVVHPPKRVALHQLPVHHRPVRHRPAACVHAVYGRPNLISSLLLSDARPRPSTTRDSRCRTGAGSSRGSGAAIRRAGPAFGAQGRLSVRRTSRAWCKQLRPRVAKRRQDPFAQKLRVEDLRDDSVGPLVAWRSSFGRRACLMWFRTLRVAQTDWIGLGQISP